MFLIQIQIIQPHKLNNPVEFDTILNQIKLKGLKMIEYSLKEYAQIKGIAYRTVLWQINKGLVQSVKRGKQRYIQMSEPTNEAGSEIKKLILELAAQVKMLQKRIDILENQLNSQEKSNTENIERKNNGRKRF